MKKYTYDLAELEQMRAQVAKEHRRATTSCDTIAGDLLVELLNVTMPRLHAMQEVMRVEGNYPWTDEELLQKRLTEVFPNPEMNKLVELDGLRYQFQLFKWTQLFTYTIDELRLARTENERAKRRLLKIPPAKRGVDVYVPFFASSDHLHQVESAMRMEGNFPWTKEQLVQRQLNKKYPSAQVGDIVEHDGCRYVYVDGDLEPEYWQPTT